jgi:hypothetical protein
MSTGKSEAVGLRLALETGGLGVSPTVGWLVMQPDQAGITDFYLNTTTVQPAPMSTSRQMEAPEIVDGDAMPKFVGDLTMDHLYAVRESVMLVVTKHSGGTGLSRFRPTARTTTDFTVPALGALPAGTLVSSKGWLNAANNGLFVVGASSTGTAIKVSGGVAETPSGYTPIVEVAGFRGAASDITVDVNGNILSTIADFTTMGLNVGQVIYLGGAPGTAFSFALGYIGFVKLDAIAAHQLTTSIIHRQWTQGALDAGTGKTIDLRFNSWLREVDILTADYQEPSNAMELAIPGIGAGNATVYCYAQGNLVDTMEITAASKALIKLNLTFSGTFVTQPSTTRLTGPSTAQAVLERQRFNAVTKQPYLRFVDATTGAIVSNKFQSWKLTHKNGVSPIKQQGTFGTAENIVGKAEVGIDAELYVNQVDGINAGPANTTIAFGSGFRNGDGGVFFDVPSLKFSGSPLTFPANGPVMLSAKTAGFRDAIGGYTMGVSMFADLPAS